MVISKAAKVRIVLWSVRGRFIVVTFVGNKIFDGLLDETGKSVGPLVGLQMWHILEEHSGQGIAGGVIGFCGHGHGLDSGLEVIAALAPTAKAE